MTSIPLPSDICDVIIANLPVDLPEPQRTIVAAACKNLADDYMTPNELYNAVS